VNRSSFLRCCASTPLGIPSLTEVLAQDVAADIGPISGSASLERVALSKTKNTMQRREIEVSYDFSSYKPKCIGLYSHGLGAIPLSGNVSFFTERQRFALDLVVTINKIRMGNGKYAYYHVTEGTVYARS